MNVATKSLLSMTAADLMSHQVVMVPREMSLQGAARLLAHAGVTGAPVVDDTGRCIGVLSATDFMHSVEHANTNVPARKTLETMCKPWQMQEQAIEPCCTVEDFMNKDPVLVAPTVLLGELARMMMDAHIHRLIVVDRVSEHPVGIVSSMDILAAIARADQTKAEAIDYEHAPIGAPH